MTFRPFADVQVRKYIWNDKQPVQVTVMRNGFYIGITLTEDEAAQLADDIAKLLDELRNSRSPTAPLEQKAPGQKET